MHTLGIYIMPQECDAILQKLALAQLDKQSILAQSLQHLTQVRHMLHLSVAVDYNVVEIDLNTCASQIS